MVLKVLVKLLLPFNSPKQWLYSLFVPQEHNGFEIQMFIHNHQYLEECCHAVMESQITKLDSDGKPIKSADGAKFIKGPYYEAPEPRIQQILDEYSK